MNAEIGGYQPDSPGDGNGDPPFIEQSTPSTPRAQP